MNCNEIAQIFPDENSAILAHNRYRPLFMFLNKDAFRAHIRKTLRYAYAHTGMNNQRVYVKGSNLVHRRDGKNDLVIVDSMPNYFRIKADAVPRILTIFKPNNEVYDIKSIRIHDSVNVLTTITTRTVNGVTIDEWPDIRCEYAPGDPNVKYISEITYAKIDPTSDPELPKEVKYTFSTQQQEESRRITQEV